MTDDGEPDDGDGQEPDERAEVCPAPGCGKPAGHKGFHRGAGNVPRGARDGRKRRERPRVVPLPAQSRGQAARAQLLGEAERILDDTQYRMVATTAPWAPIFAGTLGKQAEANTRAVLTLCSQHPKVLEGVLKMALFDAYVTLGTSAVALLVAVGVEVRFVAADGRLAEGFGVREVWEQVEAERAQVAEEVASHYRVGQPPAQPSGLMSELGAS